MSDETTERYYVRRREFLNEYEEMPAYIIGIVEDTREFPDDDPEKRWTDGQITLDLSDCNRRVSFDFQMYSPSERANSLRKINLIAEVVNAVRNAIEMEVESINARQVNAKPAITVTEPESTESEPARTVDLRAEFFTSQFITLGL